jgi:ATP-dependent RNA helicase DDX5/DBP2
LIVCSLTLTPKINIAMSYGGGGGGYGARNGGSNGYSNGYDTTGGGYGAANNHYDHNPYASYGYENTPTD